MVSTQILEILQTELVNKDWKNVDSLINHVVNKCGQKLSLNDISDLMKYAAFELSHDVPVRKFV